MTDGKYHPYLEYLRLDSNLEIPSHWAATMLKRVVDQSRPITYGIVQAGPNITDGTPYIRPADMTDESGVKSYEGLLRTSSQIAANYERSTIKCGDIVCSIGPSFGKLMIVPCGLGGANLTQGTARIAISTAHVPRYFFWQLRSNESYQQWESSVGGATFRALNLGPLAETKIVVPSASEQQQIANFLDHETAKIDTLIDKQQQLIKLLQEKRQAVISHAVTKGLNPDAVMKDSGVEWLGEVPEHWVVRRLKHTAKLQSGIPKGRDLTGKNSVAVPMLRVANVQDGYLVLDDVHTMKIEVHELDRYKLQSGDVLMNEGGDNDKLGRGAVWRDEVAPCIHQNHVFAIRPENIEPEWLDTLTRASYAKFYFYCVAKQSTNLASISSTNIKETPLLIPPKLERSSILSYLTGQFKRFDLLENKANLQVTLLQERRTALISAAVTGKIDVRNWQPAQAETIREASA